MIEEEELKEEYDKESYYMPKNSAKGKATNDKVTSKKSAAKGGKGESATEPDSDSS